MTSQSSCTIQILLKDAGIEPHFFANYISNVQNVNMKEISSCKLCDGQCITVKLIGDIDTDYNDIINEIIKYDSERYKIIEDQYVKIMGITF